MCCLMEEKSCSPANKKRRNRNNPRWLFSKECKYRFETSCNKFESVLLKLSQKTTGMLLKMLRFSSWIDQFFLYILVSVFDPYQAVSLHYRHECFLHRIELSLNGNGVWNWKILMLFYQISFKVLIGFKP